jgi:hypothetical protein
MEKCSRIPLTPKETVYSDTFPILISPRYRGKVIPLGKFKIKTESHFSQFAIFFFEVIIKSLNKYETN